MLLQIQHTFDHGRGGKDEAAYARMPHHFPERPAHVRLRNLVAVDVHGFLWRAELGASALHRQTFGNRRVLTELCSIAAIAWTDGRDQAGRGGCQDGQLPQFGIHSTPQREEQFVLCDTKNMTMKTVRRRNEWHN